MDFDKEVSCGFWIHRTCYCSVDTLRLFLYYLEFPQHFETGIIPSNFGLWNDDCYHIRWNRSLSWFYFAFSAVILASILKTGSVFLAILACLGVGAAFGLFNGFVIAKAKLQPFIVTLATMAIARSFTLLYTNGMPITGFDERFTYIGQGEVFTIPIPVIIMFIIFFLTWYILSKTKIGLYTYSIGGNEEAARLSGVTVDRYKMLIYMISGIYSAIGSMILTARLDSAQPTFGQGYELDAIAAVVLGGASLKGGKGTVLGTLFGALIIGTINNGLNLLNISPFSNKR